MSICSSSWTPDPNRPRQHPTQHRTHERDPLCQHRADTLRMEMADPHLVVDHVQRPDAQEQVGIHALSSAPTSIHSLLGQRVGAEPGVAPFLSLFLQFSSHSPAGLPQEFTSQQPISHRECDRRVLCTSCTHRRQRLLLGRSW